MKSTNLIEALHRDGVLDAAHLSTVRGIMAQSRKSEIYALAASGLLRNPAVAAALANRYALKMVTLADREIPAEPLKGLTADRLFRLGAVPFAFAPGDTGTLYVAMSDPTDIDAIDDIAALTSCRVVPYVCAGDEINAAIERAFHLRNNEPSAETPSPELRQDDAVIRLVTDMLTDAVRMGASDVHIEGMPEVMRVRCRIDGVLYEKSRHPIDLMPSVATRVKIMGGMDIAEKRLPQDGKFATSVDGAEYDVRVSVIPTVYGEKCELRIAPKRLVFNNKKDLGLFEDDIEKLGRLFAAPHGLVLITGPTGSGKTTTLYSALSELNTISTNIVTIEDPVEVSIPGINQIQLHRYGGLTFSSVLRSVLRQDPNVIMIGEIRDAETARVAVQASITGHLVLSTLHTNSAAGAINRLVNMGVERYLLSDALVGVVSQRLVRKLCPKCKQPYQPTDAELRFLRLREPAALYRGGKCASCGGTGYAGRTSVYEIMEIDGGMRRLIAADTFETKEILSYARERGMRTLFESAVRLAENGITSTDEIRKIATGGTERDE